MARPRERVCLEQGLKLDLVQLAREGFIRFGANVGPRRIQWQDGMSGEVTASGIITADMTGPDFGWLQINMDRRRSGGASVDRCGRARWATHL